MGSKEQMCNLGVRMQYSMLSWNDEGMKEIEDSDGSKFKSLSDS